jgi:hypothetical protein
MCTSVHTVHTEFSWKVCILVLRVLKKYAHICLGSSRSVHTHFASNVHIFSVERPQNSAPGCRFRVLAGGPREWGSGGGSRGAENSFPANPLGQPLAAASAAAASAITTNGEVVAGGNSRSGRSCQRSSMCWHAGGTRGPARSCGEWCMGHARVEPRCASIQEERDCVGSMRRRRRAGEEGGKGE